jgi:tetratricopeptide (TPR) repeat protein
MLPAYKTRMLAWTAVVTMCYATWARAESCASAASLFRQHRWAEAADAYSSCEASAPGQTDALLYRGKALVNANQFAAAAQSLDAYLKTHSQSDDALYLQGYVRFRQDQPRESLETFQRAAKLKRPAAADLKIAALDYVLLEDYNSAARYLEESLRLNPGDLEARYHLGRVRYQLNQFDAAISAFESVLKANPGDLKAQNNLGLCLEGKNEVAAALAAYHKAINLDAAAHSEQPYLNLGKLLLTLNRNAEAVDWLQKAVSIAPQSSSAHYELGRAQLSLNQLEPARAQLEQAIRLNDNESSPHYLLGRIYKRLGRDADAAAQFAITEQLIRSQNAKSGGMSSPH